ncbi:MAG: CRISPR-associated endonuclease Cas2 [Gemmataceae bacterium]|nr:CRISPR-associated endonuclease Cas2 [Gemmataceae bacterium]
MESWLVAYDISDPKRLRRVARACEDYGTRKQLSVFLMRLAPREMEKLRGRLLELIHHDEDQVMIVPITDACLQEMETMGRPMEAYDARDVVVVA